MAGTQVVIGSEEIVPLNGESEQLNIYYAGAGILMAGAAVYCGQRRKRQGLNASTVSRKDGLDGPEVTTPGKIGVAEKAEARSKSQPCCRKESLSHKGRKLLYTTSSLICLFLMMAFFWMAWPQTGKTVSADPTAKSTSRYLTQNIEDIQVDDDVMAYDIRSGKVTKRKVTEVFRHQSDHLRYLAVDDSGDKSQTFITTDVHPYWVVTDSPDLSRMARELVTVEDVGHSPLTFLHEKLDATEHGYYVEAGDLLPGDVFLGPSGELATLAKTWRIDYPEGTPVYNFHVADDHNYFVIANYEDFANGAQPVLVHNNGCNFEITWTASIWSRH